MGAGFAAFGGVENGDGLPKPTEEERSVRNEALTRARVFLTRDFDASKVDFSIDPNAGIVDPTLTTCKYAPDEVTGTTPKFDCELPNGDKVKVKYGYTKEIPSELATTRLLGALGFGADHVSLVKTVRCYGCPFQPYHLRSLMEMLHLDKHMDKRLDYTSYRDFNDVSVERNLEGEQVEAGDERGWAFYELKTIDPSKGGASRAEVDALRLVAKFLHHWDNKTSNQRLICVDSEKADCAHPLAMIQDVGSDFGPKKVDLAQWGATPLWSGDASACRLSMKGMPYDGGTFEDVEISEEGRQLLAARLRALTPKQITALFTAAGLDDVPGWTATFQDKVRQIADRPACRSTKTSS